MNTRDVLALGDGPPMSEEEGRRILAGDLQGWEVVDLDRVLREGEEVYVISAQAPSGPPCRIVRTERLSVLLTGLEPPQRVVRRTR